MDSPIRILQVVGIMNRGGIETALMNYYRQIDRTKIQFDFAVHGSGVYDEEIRVMGGELFYLPRLTTPLSLFSWKKAFTKILKENDYKTVHAQCGAKNRFILSCANQFGTPVRIAHSHGMPPWWFWILNLKAGILHLFFTLFWNWNATHFFAIGQEAGNKEFGKKISNSPRFSIVRLAIDCEKFRFNPDDRKKCRQEFNFSDQTIVLGHVGRFTKEKNHHFLIQLFAMFHMIHPESKLLLIGTGPLENSIKEEVKRENLSDAILFPGSRADIPHLMNAMDFFIFPSRWETFGIVAIEAQASGLPCMLSDTLPKEVGITAAAYFLPHASPKCWLETLQANLNPIRSVNAFKAIQDAGFDIIQNTKWLETFYLTSEK